MAVAGAATGGREGLGGAPPLGRAAQTHGARTHGVQALLGAKSEAAMPDLLPDFVQGWYLLQDSGLSTSEKNIVQTALQGDFSLQKVAQELRNQWPANELQRREGAGKHVSYLGDYQDESAEEHGAPIMDNFVAEEQLDDAGMALWAGAESEAQTALALLHGAKKTLKEARARQHDVRMSRQYFKTTRTKVSGDSRSDLGRNRDDSKMTCLRCGKVGHRAANCPQTPQHANTTAEVDASLLRLLQRPGHDASGGGLCHRHQYRRGGSPRKGCGGWRSHQDSCIDCSHGSHHGDQCGKEGD